MKKLISEGKNERREFILKLKEIRKSEGNLVGNKAARLAILSQNGVFVPEALVLSTEAFYHFLAQNNLHFIYEAMTENLSLEDLAFFATDLRRKILKFSFPGRLKEEIEKEVKKTNFSWFSVRSSATVEDSHVASFAGLFETDLNFKRERILEGIKKCWASAFSSRVVVYAKRKDIPLNKIKMAVIIQKMIRGEKAGTLRTQNPILKKRGESIIEAVRGVSDEVTSGVKNPEIISLDRNNLSILKRKLDASEKKILKDLEAKELLKMGILIEQFFSMPQEIEWIMLNDQIYILQSRPIVV